MESPTKQYKSIEASVFAIDAHYGEGKDVKYWRSKMRRREEKQLTEKMYLKNKQRHISMHEYMSNKKKNSKTKTSKKNVVSNRNKRRR